MIGPECPRWSTSWTWSCASVYNIGHETAIASRRVNKRRYTLVFFDQKSSLCLLWTNQTAGMNAEFIAFKGLTLSGRKISPHNGFRLFILS